MAYYNYPGVSGRFSGGITNPAQNPLLQAGAGIMNQRFSGGRSIGNGMSILKPMSGPAAPTRPASALAAGATAGTAAGPTSVGVWGAPAAATEEQKKSPFYDYQAAPAAPEFIRPEGPADFVGANFTGANYTAYDPQRWSDQPNVDTKAIVDANKYLYEDEMRQNMGEASRRFGASGAIRSSGHADALGAAERKMFSDINALGLKYGYDAAQQDANRSLSAFSDYEGRRANEAARQTGFSQSEAARKTGFDVGQAGSQNAYNQYVYGAGADQAGAENAFNWQNYSAGLNEAQRKQMYDMLKMKYGM